MKKSINHRINCSCGKNNDSEPVNILNKISPLFMDAKMHTALRLTFMEGQGGAKNKPASIKKYFLEILLNSCQVSFIIAVFYNLTFIMRLLSFC
jgi:hypothetical protein